MLLPLSGFHTFSFPFRAFPWFHFDAWKEKLDLAAARETREAQFLKIRVLTLKRLILPVIK